MDRLQSFSSKSLINPKFSSIKSQYVSISFEIWSISVVVWAFLIFSAIKCPVLMAFSIKSGFIIVVIIADLIIVKKMKEKGEKNNSYGIIGGMGIVNKKRQK